MRPVARFRFALLLAASAGVTAFAACSSFSEEEATTTPDEAGGDVVVDGLLAPGDERIGNDSAVADGGPRSYRDTIMAAKPIAYWRMGVASSGIIKDESGNQNALVLGAPVGIFGGEPGAIAGDPDTATRFDGTTGYARATDSAPFVFPNRVPFAFELWAKREVDDDAGYRTMLSHQEGFGATRLGYSLYFAPPNATSPAPLTVFEITGAGTERQSTAPTVALRTWTHYAGVRGTDKLLTLYVDGVAFAPALSGTDLAPTTVDLLIGANTPGGNEAFTGTIDEVAIYDHALTATEIAARVAFRRAN